MKTAQKYRFISDPGHGWLEVPIEELLDLGIWDKISGYSYQKGGMAYLEEDCDAPLFIDAWQKANAKRYIHAEREKEVYQENTPIRGYASVMGAY